MLQDARVVRDYATERTGLRTVVWQQELEGLRIFESTFQAHVTKNGALVNIASRLVPDAAAAAKTGSPQHATPGVKPPIDAKRAVSEAARTVGENLPPARVAEAGPAEGPASKQRFKSVPLLDISTEKVWLPIDETALRLAWEVIFTSKARGEMFRAIIDAENGTPLVLQGLTEYLTDASYRVWTSDSPSPFSPGNQTPVTTQPPVVPRTLVTTGALDTTASPNGWIDDGINELRGNNVDAHTDTNADNVADLPRAVGSPFRVFDFPVDLAQAPSSYTAAAVTDLFYWNNWLHDRFYQLGFTEAAGNFQNNNFGRGGMGNDAVQADAQDGSGTNNANFSTPPDGQPGRMQMYVFNGPNPDRDGDFDHEIVIHEATHGLSNRLVGGGVGITAVQSRGMGEGWSDFYALSLLSESTDNPNAAYANGGYATYQLGGMTTNYYYGIRRYPYSTDLSKNPLTFKDIDPNLASPHTGVPLSPRYSSSNASPSQVHGQGELWCVTLWEARANLIAKHGATAGNNLILELVTDGMKLSPANPNFLQSRDAILQADLVGSNGANLPELWKAFAKRGMGQSAVAPPNYTTYGVQEAYDVPGDLTVSPMGPLALGGQPGGPFTPVSTVYTLRNTGAAAMNWSVVKNQPWLNVAPASGSLAPQASVQVTVTANTNANSLTVGQYADTLTFDYPGNPRSAVTRPVMLTIKAAAPPVHPGWPNNTGGKFTSVADLDNDGKLEVLSINGAILRIFKHGGTSFTGWPQNLTTTAVGPPSVADVDGDGVKEVAIIDNNSGTRNGNIYLWKSNGTAMPGWPKSFVSSSPWISYTISPVLEDLDADGKLEIIYTSATSLTGGNIVINIAKVDGTAMSGWPVTFPSSIGAVYSTPAVADFDGDGQLDIAMITYGNKVYVYRRNGTLFPGFPLTIGFGGNPSGNVTFADVNHDGRLELIATEYNGEAAIYNSSGQPLPGWPKKIGTIPRPPAIADLDGDGDLEIAFGTQDAVFQVFHHTGQSFQGWPKILPSRCFSPAIADLDDDGQLDLLATDGVGNLHAWDRFGNPLLSRGFPFSLGSDMSAPPIVADLDSNGTAEVIAYSTTLNIRDLSSQLRPATTPWPMMFQDTRAVSRYAPAPGPIAMEPNRVHSGVSAQIVITGDHFLKGMKVTIDGVPQVVTAETATTINVTVAGLSSTGLKTVVLSNANFGSVTYANSFVVGLPLLVTAPASANEGAGVLAGQGSISLPAAAAADTVINLQSSDPSEVTVPVTVTVPAGQSQVAFDVTVVDDAQLDGSQSATITASGSGLGDASTTVVVHDNETATLSLNIPASASEGGGTVQGTVSISSAPGADVTVTLASSLAAEAQVPDSVVVRSGQTSAVFPLTIVDDGAIDGSHVATITARVSNWTEGSANLTVLDNESTSLTLVLPMQLREGSGAQVGSVRIAGTLPNALVVNLSSGDPSEVTVPATVTIPAGQTSATFSVASVNDLLTDGAQIATITASAAGFTDGTGTVTVADNDVHHFIFGTIVNDQARGVPFDVTLIAEDINGARITNYAGVANLTATGDGGPVGITPASTGGFQNGIWNGTVTVNSLATQVVLKADDGDGHLGVSNAFDVIQGAVDRFSWDTIASPRPFDTPFRVTLRALDAGGVLVPDYRGSADLFALTAAENLTIGSGTSASITPIYTYYHDLRTQILYTAGEVGSAARITALAFNVISVAAGGEPLTNLTIRLKHTTRISLPNSAGWDNADWTTVYRASPRVSASGWVTFTFTTPFYFDGTSNLLVDLSMDRTSSSLSHTYVQVSGGGESSVIYAANNSTHGDPLEWSGTNPLPSGGSRPNIRFSGQKEIPLSPRRTGEFAGGVWSGDVSVPVVGTSIQLVARAGAASGTSNTFQMPPQSVPTLAVNPKAVPDSTGVRGGPFDPLIHTFTVYNVGMGSMSWTASPNVPWIKLAPTGGTLPAGGNARVTVTLSPNSLLGGNHSGLIMFTNTTNGQGTTARTVAVVAAPLGALGVTPTTNFEAVSQNGGPASPASQTYVLTNYRDAPLNWTATEQIPWLNLSATSGMLAPNESVNVVASIDPAIPSPGKYSGTVTFTNTTSGQGNTTRTASLTVELPAPPLAGEPATTPGTSNTISWSAVPGAQSYEAEVATNAGFSGATSSGWLSTTNHTFDSLSEGRRYYYRVRARSLDGNVLSAWSNTETSLQFDSPPVIAQIARQTVLEDSLLAPLPFTVGDDSTSAEDLVVSAATSHPALLPEAGLLLGGSGADRTIQPTLAPNANGTATVTLRVTEGPDRFSENSFEVVVRPVNDPPSFAAGGNLEVLQGAGLQTIPNWATQIKSGPADEAGQTLDFQLKVSDPRLFATPVRIAPDGTLTFAPAAGVSGTATVTVRLHDSGGLSDGGRDLSDAQTFTISIRTFGEELGSYNGLVRAIDPGTSTAEQFGLIRLNIARGGKFTGKLTVGGKTQSLTGSFDRNGEAKFGKDGANTWAFKRTNQPTLRVSLKLEMGSGGDRLTGGIEDDHGPRAVISADRLLFSTARTLVPPYVRLPEARLGAYTVLFNPPSSDLPDGQTPPSYGSASVVVSGTGSVRMVATLADGTKFTYSNFLSKSFEWPLHFASATAGCLNGPVQFEADEISGSALSWFRPETKHSIYPQGWPGGIQTELIGSKYQRPTAEEPVFTDLPPPDDAGNIRVSLSEGGLVDAGFQQAMNVINGSKMVALPPNANRVTMTLNAATGLFRGSFKHPETGRSTKFNGAVLQKQSFGGGSFLGTEAGGRIRLAPPR